MQNAEPLPHRLLVAHARPEAFARRTQSIMKRLGYEIVCIEDFEDALNEGEFGSIRPDLRIVDERRLGEIDECGGEASLPMIVLTGRHGVTGADSRIVGAVKRPAGLHDLYRLVQQLFEDTPRTTPRVPTHLRTHCRRRGVEWDAAVLSMSENGCLLRTSEAVPLGSSIHLSFNLPSAGPIELKAETAYQLVPDLGLIFSGLTPDVRNAISSFVTETLAV
jgi:hypothetical protein